MTSSCTCAVRILCVGRGGGRIYMRITKFVYCVTIHFYCTDNRLNDVMVSMLASSAVYRGLKP